MTDTDEIAERGERVYGDSIRDKVESNRQGEYVVLDVDTGEFEVNKDRSAALDRMETRRPNSNLYIVRVGYPAAVRIGGAAASNAR